ncbi:MAG: phage holin [Parvibaculaceae bacterium]|nr:phage holin [Parvibaculaceae bacterium]
MIDTAFAKGAEPTTYAASLGVSFFGALTMNEWIAVGGLALGGLTFATNVYFKWLHYKLAERQANKGAHKNGRV